MFELDAPLTAEQKAGAIVSTCGLYRYRLHRMWDLSLPVMVFCGMNPSVADATRSDLTLAKTIGFAKRHRHGGVILVNLFALRATDPNELRRKLATWARSDVVGTMNDEHIAWACSAPPLATVVVAWGTGWTAGRDGEVLSLLRNLRKGNVKCLGKTADGRPRHPSRLAYDTPLEEM